MKKISKRIKKRPILLFMIVFFVLFLLSSICLTYSILKVSNIENLLRYLISILIIFICIFSFLECYKLIFKGKSFAIILIGIIFAILFIGESYTCGIINGLYSSIKNIYKENQTYSVSLVALSNNNIKDIKDVKSFKIGLISDKESVDYKIAKNIIKENNLETSNEIVMYDTTGKIIEELYNKKIDMAFLPKDYVSMYSNINTYSNIKNDTISIISKSETIEKEDDNIIINSTDPFTILILGIDSTTEDISKITSFNGDSLMLITFNPTTYNATITSIPRDTYVPIACVKNTPSSKITHSGWYGESCLIKTIENWIGININYYVKVNFTGVVNLVDALDGVEVNVPYSFCEQNSKREWGENTVYVKKGLQTLNGEQALALSRNRHSNPDKCSSEWTNYYSDDIIRGQNQQLVINALINKIIKNVSLEKIYSLLDILGKNIDTNMKINEITSYYKLAKDIALNNNKDAISFDRLYISTYGKNLYDPLLNMAGMSIQIYYEESLKEVIKAMKANLELEKPEIIKEMNFSINSMYTSPKIGIGNYTQQNIDTVPNFINKDKSIALSWGEEKGINIIIEYIDTNEGVNDTIISQSIPSTYIVDNITSSLTIKVRNVIDQDDNPDIDYPTE